MYFRFVKLTMEREFAEVVEGNRFSFCFSLFNHYIDKPGFVLVHGRIMINFIKDTISVYSI